MYPNDVELLQKLLDRLTAIYEIIRPRLSATIFYKGEHHMAVNTLLIGNAPYAPNYQEWSGPGGTGVALPPAGAVTYVSSNPAVVSVDASGNATALTVGTATITATDATNSLVATANVTIVEPVAQSATLSYGS